MENSEIILTLVKIQVQFRFMHWQTTSFSQHKAYGEIYESLDENIDTFVEACMGKHGRPKYTGGYTIEGEDLEEIELSDFLNQINDFLISFNGISISYNKYWHNLFVIDKPLTPGLYLIEIINSEDELITIKHVVK